MTVQEKLLKQLLHEFKGMKSDISEIKSEITDMKSEITDMKSEITGMKSEITGMKSEITGMKSEITGIKSEITGINSEITGINSEITGMKSEITEIKSTMATKQEIKSIHVKLDKLSQTIQIQHVENINSDNLLLNEIRTLNEGVIFINRKVADNELEINQLKHNRQ